MSTQRTDPHRPGAIIPQDYTDLFWFDCGGAEEPSWGINCMKPVFDWYSLDIIPGRAAHDEDGGCCVLGLRNAGYKDAKTGRDHGPGKCTVCGTYFRFGAVWIYKPTNELVFVGHDCADKYNFVASTMDRAGWAKYKAALDKKHADAARDAKHAKARDKFIETNGLAEVFALRKAEPNPFPEFKCPEHGSISLTNGTDEEYNRLDERIEACRGCWKANQDRNRHRDRKNEAISILKDMYNKLHNYGSLSEKQVAFARKLAETVTTWKPEEKVEEAKVAAPIGRHTFTGTIVSAKWYDSDFGGSTKITVKMTTPEGIWLAWGTCPSGFKGDIKELPGRTITLKGTLTAGNEPHFAFFKRPTLIEQPEVVNA